MTALSLAIVIVGLAAIGAAWHIATRLLDRRLVIAGEAKLREEMAAVSRKIGEVSTAHDSFANAVADDLGRYAHRIDEAHTLAKKAEERARSIDVAQRVGGRS